MAKNRAKEKNLPFDIDADYVFQLYNKQNGLCAISNLEFNLAKPDKAGHTRFDAPSLDRIIPELGYTKGNVRLVIYQVNCALSNFGLDTFLYVINKIQERHA